jgi:hypothetical protein
MGALATLLFLLKTARPAITATRATPATVAVTIIMVVVLLPPVSGELTSVFSVVEVEAANFDADEGRPAEKDVE